MKRKKNITKKDMIDMIRQATTMSLANKKTLDMLGEFLYNYLDMKGDKGMEKFLESPFKKKRSRNNAVKKQSKRKQVRKRVRKNS